MTELFKTSSNQGTVLVDETHVTLKTLAKKTLISRSSITAVTSEIGKGSFLGAKTVTIYCTGGGEVVLKNVPSKKADELQRLLS